LPIFSTVKRMTTARGGSRGPSNALADRVADGVCSQKKVSEDETVQLMDVTFEPLLDGTHASRKFAKFKVKTKTCSFCPTSFFR
jgi:hypothetical protein